MTICEPFLWSQATVGVAPNWGDPLAAFEPSPTQADRPWFGAIPLAWWWVALLLLSAKELLTLTRLVLSPTLTFALLIAWLVVGAGMLWSVRRCPPALALALPSRRWAPALLVPVLAAVPVVVAAEGLAFAQFGFGLDPGALALLVTATGLAIGLTMLAGTETKSTFLRAASSRVRNMVILGVSVSLALLAKWMTIRFFPLDDRVSDMLPSIQVAVTRWLGGGALYGTNRLGSHEVPTPYLPLTELVYAPLVWPGWDLRWFGVWGLGAVVVLLVAASRGRNHGLNTALGVFASSPLLIARHDLYTYPQWLLVTIFGISVAHRRWNWASVSLGLGMAAVQLVVLMVPIYAVLVLREKGLGPALLHTAGALAIAVAIVAPFFLAAPQEFSYGIWGQYRYDAGPAVEPLADFSGEAGLSLSPLLRLLGIAGWRLPLQAVAMIGIFFGAAWAVRTPSGGLLWSAAAVEAFLLFNHPSWPYLRLPVLLLCLCGLYAREREGALVEAGPRTGRTGRLLPSVPPLRYGAQG